ncbi:MAG: MauE/DoxX family redox-associated membrane protein [Gaiellaceae bacterium]
MSHDLVRIAVWAFAGVFVVAGAAKLLSPSATAAAIVRFGLLRSPSVAVARAVGIAELVLAASIVLAAGTVVPLAVAMIALVATSFLIARALVRGEDFPCGCFGQSDKPLSRWTLLRNLLLIGVSASLLAVLASEPAYLSFGSLRDELVRAVAAVSVLCSGFLVAAVTPLLTWNTTDGQVRKA